MVKQATELLELILKIFALIGGIATAIIFIRKWWKSYTAKMNTFFVGSWGNEGCIGYFPSYYIELDLTAEGNDLNGVFNIRNAKDDHTWNGVSISGKRYFNRAKCKILHIRHGKVLPYGVVTLSKNGKKLKWKLKEGVADFFPKEETMFRR